MLRGVPGVGIGEKPKVIGQTYDHISLNHCGMESGGESENI